MKTFLFSCLESRVEAGGALFGRFLLGPLPRGEGTTIATVLRRSLLADVPGLAITTIEVVGVHNEYSVIPGSHETVVDVSLNLRKLIFTSTEPLRTHAIGYFAMRGPGTLTGHDLRLPPGLQCVNPDQVIATVAANGFVNIKVVVSAGKTYVAQHGFDALKPKFRQFGFSSIRAVMVATDFANQTIFEKKGMAVEPFLRYQTKKEKTIAPDTRAMPSRSDSRSDSRSEMAMPSVPRTIFNIDAVFMPVLRVTFAIESDEDILDVPHGYDAQAVTERVLFEVWTNGTLTPREAMHEAASASIRLLSHFRMYGRNNLRYAHPTRTPLHRQPAPLDGASRSGSRIATRSDAIGDSLDSELIPAANSLEAGTHIVQSMYAYNPFLRVDIGVLPLNPTIFREWKAHQIHCLEDLLDVTYDDLIAMPGMDREAVLLLLVHLRHYGMHLKATPPGALQRRPSRRKRRRRAHYPDVYRSSDVR